MMAGGKRHNIEKLVAESAVSPFDGMVGPLVDATGALVVVLKPDGQIVWANPAFKNICDIPNGNFAEQKLWAYLPETADTRSVKSALSALRDGDHSTQSETGLRSPSGFDKRVSWTHAIAPNRCGGEELTVCLGIIAARPKHVEQTPFAAKEDAEKLAAITSRFFAAASHDLLQPLQAIGLLITVLRESTTNKETQETINDISHAHRIMGDMLNSLLEISRLDAGMVSPEIINFPVNDLLDRQRRVFCHLAKERGLDLRVVPCKVDIRSDPALLGKILENFVSNAVRYSQMGKILLGCRRHGDFLRIEVWDSGVGIAETKIESIFEEYSRLGNAARDRDRGLGLGLALVRRISRILDHQVRTKSIQGKGSMFSVELPIATESKSQGQNQRVARIFAPPLEGVAVILVENGEQVDSATQHLLERWGARVITAKSAREAVRKSISGAVKPGLIIADHCLSSDENGAQAIERIRNQVDKALPAILVTGETSRAMHREIGRAQLLALQKPIKPAKLRSLIRHLGPKSLG